MDQNQSVNIKHISIDKILPNPHQPRKNFDIDALNELAESIKQYGLISPVQVRQLANGLYELISGERRLRASRIAGLKMIPAIPMEASDEDSAVMAVLENIQRENLSCFEEAHSYSLLIEYYHMTQEQVAKALGKSQSFVANKIRLLKLSPDIIDLVLEHGLSERHARALLKLPDKKTQEEIIKRIVKSGLNVKQTENLINKKLKDLDAERKEKLKNKQSSKSVIDSQVCVNTIKSAFELVKDNSTGAQYSESEDNDSIIINIVIPK